MTEFGPHGIKCIHTVCPIRLDTFHIVIYYICILGLEFLDMQYIVRHIVYTNHGE